MASAKTAPTASPTPKTVNQISRHEIHIHGARSNNLKNVDLRLPKNKLIVVTGVSGSGKSSITMDTLYAEGQRRYVESLSSYARQFLGRMKKPDVDYIHGICPAIAIEQKVATSQCALDGRDPHGDLRFPAPALRPRRQDLLTDQRQRGQAPPGE